MHTAPHVLQPTPCVRNPHLARQVFCGVYLLAPRTQTDHGRRAGAGAGAGDDDGAGSDGEASDLTRMLRLDGEHEELCCPPQPVGCCRVAVCGRYSVEV